MRRLILISHRLPAGLQATNSSRPTQRPAGGLVAALGPLWSDSESIWIGVPADGAKPTPRLVGLDIPLAEQRRYYEGFSNGVLWPLFHYFIESVRLSPKDYDAYRSVNQRFADAVVATAKPGDRIWIHDYQLMLLPALIRARLPDAHIGFFLHIPFPASDVYRILPMAEELLHGLAGADLIGFHTYDYARHFVSSWRRVTGGDFQNGAVSLGGRSSRVGVFPLGVDAVALADRARLPVVTRGLKRWHKAFAGRKVILGVDRLDYTKGIVLRLRAYRQLLENHPRWAREAVFVQLAVPTRSAIPRYRNLKGSIEELVGEINGAFGTEGLSPVHYMYRSVSPNELAALYRLADVMVVTPIRDGMNLVAKEYVASRLDDTGVLVLSRFAGAASELGEATMINPWDERATASGILEALEMDAATQGRRMGALRQRVKGRSASDWQSAFLGAMKPISASSGGKKLNPKKLKEAFSNAKRALVLLDYDGTLVSYAPTPELAAPDAQLLSLLTRLTARGHCETAITSGRNPASLDAWFADFDVHLVAEHGFFLRERGAREWSDVAPDADLSWMALVREVMVEYTTRTPGTWIEAKKASVAWHYRSAEYEHGLLSARELADHLSDMFNDYPLQVLHGNCVVEVRAHGIHKGLAYKALIQRLGLCDFVFAAGDDRTDEELFRVLPEHAWTIKVGDAPSVAKYRCNNVDTFRAALEAMLEQAEGSAGRTVPPRSSKHGAKS